MDRNFRRLHWRWLAMCAITATLAGCAPAPVAETDAESGALMAGSAGSAGAEAMAEGQTPAAVPSAGKRSSRASRATPPRSEEHTSELQSPCNLVCRLLLEKKNKTAYTSLSPSPTT